MLLLVALRAAQSPLTGILAVGALSLFAIAGIIHIRTTRLVLTASAVEHHGLMVRDRVIDFADARGVLGVMTQRLAASVPTLVVQSRTTGDNVRIFGGLWNREQLEAIADRVDAVRLTEPVDGATMDTYVPGAIPLRYRRPLAFGLSAGVVVIAAAIALAAALT